MLALLKPYLCRRQLVVFVLGFASGLPIALVLGTLQAWYTVSNVDIVSIGLLSLVGQPYIYKFLWAPFMDRFVPPLLGRRRGWMLVTQIALIVALVAVSFQNPAKQPLWLAILALITAFCSASQDIAIDAYRTDMLQPEERGIGAAMTAGGYRVGMVIAGGLALVFADHIGWHLTYLLMAGLMGLGVAATFWAPEVAAEKAPATLQQAVIEPFKEFYARPQSLLLLLLIVLYKMGDAFAVALSSPFLIRGVHFSLSEVGMLNKILGLSATIVGVFVGGGLLRRWSIYRALLIFGCLQAVTNLLYMALSIVGHNLNFAAVVIAFDNFCGGLGTAAFLAWLMGLCHHRYTATQFALLSALSAVGRTFIGPAAGVMVAHLGWTTFFFWTFIASLPGLLLVMVLRGGLERVELCQPKNL